ncbi:MAG: hypothetical protein U5J96_07350 [Ignavibacteriaceae bacterium]|nr:hypothetical protein [Ignavibacteriaceae bacterium]
MIRNIEISVVASGLTTVPSNQLTGPIWGFNGTVYVNMSSGTLEPGYAYWVKLLSDCDIIIPEAMAKGSGDVAEYSKKTGARMLIVRGDSCNTVCSKWRRTSTVRAQSRSE